MPQHLNHTHQLPFQLESGLMTVFPLKRTTLSTFNLSSNRSTLSRAKFHSPAAAAFLNAVPSGFAPTPESIRGIWEILHSVGPASTKSRINSSRSSSPYRPVQRSTHISAPSSKNSAASATASSPAFPKDLLKGIIARIAQ